jgi:acyl-CoA synthetase (AMP-forming)/AMP-acid ligase II
MAALVTDPISWWAQEMPDEPAIVFGGTVVSYAELDGWLGRVAAWYAEAGVAVGDRVGVIGSNSAAWCVAALGVIRAGAVLVPLNVRLRADELADLVEGSTPRVVVAESGAPAETMKGLAAGPHRFELVDLSFGSAPGPRRRSGATSSPTSRRSSSTPAARRPSPRA